MSTFYSVNWHRNEIDERIFILHGRLNSQPWRGHPAGTLLVTRTHGWQGLDISLGVIGKQTPWTPDEHASNMDVWLMREPLEVDFAEWIPDSAELVMTPETPLHHT